MIELKNLSKDYFTRSGRKRVLSNVNLNIAVGDKIGLLGRNGSGKSTLIRVLGGVEVPTQGSVKSSISISWPLAFHGGFQGSLSGSDNARFIARIYNREYNELLAQLEEFAELKDYLRMPVKTYSSGMRARLAFGLSIAIDFDCYLIDEVIMVGDQTFQRKSHYELFERKQRTLIIASHDPHIIRTYCNKAVVLNKGVATEYDDIENALAIYSEL